MAIDPISKKVGDGEVKLPLDNPAIVSALQKGNIHDVHRLLADYGLTAADFEQFAANQHAKYMSAVVQSEPIYEGEASMPIPDFDAFPLHDASNALSNQDIETASAMIGKAMSAGKGQKDKSPDFGSMQRHYDEWNQYWDGVIEPKLIEIQLTQQLQAKSDELERELQKIIAMARSGEIDDPTVIILALTKVNVEKNGLIFTQLGQRVLNYNKQANTVTEWLKQSPSFERDVVAAQSKLRTIGQSTTFLMNDMNQVVQNIQSSLTFAKSSIDAINNTKMEIIRKIAASGG